MADARPIMQLWCTTYLVELGRESCVTGLWASIINEYYPISVNPAGNPLGQPLLAAEVHTTNENNRADLILHETIQRDNGNRYLRPRIVFEAKGATANDNLTKALGQCRSWTHNQNINSLGNEEVCFFIAAKGRYVKMQVCKRQSGGAPRTKALNAVVNGTVVTLTDAMEDTSGNGTEIDMGTADGRDIVHAAMQRIGAQLAPGQNNGRGKYSWVV